MRRVVTIVVVCLLAAHARAGGKREAAKLFEEGRELVAQARFAEACERFAQSNELERAAGTELNLGDCEEHLGHLAEAWRWFDDAATLWEQDDGEEKRATYARNRADTVKQRLAETKTARVDAPADTVPAAPPAPAPASHRDGWRVAFWGAAVVAVAGVGVYVYGKNEVDDARDQLCHGGAYASKPECQFPVTLTQVKVDELNAQGDRGRELAIAGSVAAGLAGAFAAVSLYEGYLKRVTVAPIVAPGGGGGASLGFTW
jgi:tetratricopeptide (TPR) repeat protein